jgi:uncharacterized protein
MDTAAPAPSRRAEPPGSPRPSRLVGYDLARAWAVCGMVAVHAGLVLSRPGEVERAWPAAVLQRLDGRPAALFMVLAGIGVSLRAGGGPRLGEPGPGGLVPGPSPGEPTGGLPSDPPAVVDPDRRRRAARTLVRRGLFLLVVGFLNLAIWEGDILRVYGVSLVVAAGLLGARNRTLWAAAAAFACGFIGLLAAADYGRNWDWRAMEYHHLWTPAGVVRNLFYDGFRSVFPWTGLLIFGMWLGRLDVRRPRVRRRMLLWGAGVAAATELASWLTVRWWLAHPGATPAEDVVAVAGTASMPPLPVFLLAAGGTAVAAVAAGLILAERFAGSTVLAAMVATGQMAFTWYVAHIGLIAVAFVAGANESLSFAGAMAVAATSCATALAVSLAWKRRARHGPLEWVMRAVAG